MQTPEEGVAVCRFQQAAWQLVAEICCLLSIFANRMFRLAVEGEETVLTVAERLENATVFGQAEEILSPCKGAAAPALKYVEPPPYAAAWNGGHSFSRSLSAGNYSMSAQVNGSFVPVDLVLQTAGGFGRCAAWRATSEVEVVTRSTSRGENRYHIPKGGMWTTDRVAQGQCQPLAIYAVEPYDPTGPVDSSGRW